MKKLTIFLTQILACGLLAAPSSAQFIPQATAIPGSAPEGINYQGRLEDGGFPVNATKSMIFRVYSAPVGGVLLWTSPAQAVPVTLGLFSAVVPVPTTVLVGGGARYLELQIDATLMAPRELLNSVPYALIAKSVEGNIDVSTAGLSINANSAAPQPALYISSVTGNVGIGTGAPITAFDVGGSAQFGSGTTKSTFSAAGALNTAGKVTAPDYTATYGINASTAVFTYVLSSSMTTTGNVNVQGSVGVGTPNPGTKLHLSSGVLTIDGNATNALTTVGRVGIGTALPASKLHLSTGTLIIDGNTATALTTIGSVGVGTASPGTKLHLSSGTLTVDGNTATALTTVGNVGVGTSLPASKLHMSSGTLIIDGNSANSLTTTGSVGIGTTGPAAKLHVSSGTVLIDGNAATAFRVGVSSFIIDSEGKVGIGTTAPDVRLDVRTSGAPSTDGLNILNNTDTHNLNIRPSMSAGANNGIVQAGDTGIIYTNGTIGTGNFVVAPWAAATSGLRMNANGNVGIGTAAPASKLHMSSGTLTIDGNVATSLATTGNVGIGTSLPTSKLHMSSGTIIVDGNAATAITTVGNAGVGTGGFTPNDRLEVAGGSVRLTAVAGTAGSVKLFSALTVLGTDTCTSICGANTFCLAAWTSAGAASTCGTAVAANRCLCSGFGN